MKAIFVVMNSAFAVVKIGPDKKNSGLYGIWTLQYRLCALPTEPTNQLGADHYVDFK